MSQTTRALEAVRALLYHVEGPASDREGLDETPARVVRALEELTAGYAQDPGLILSKVFSESDGYDQMVVLRDIEFTSLCEHHLLPFSGTAVVAYIPQGKVVGLSKLARVVECFARRLQLQERMTQQIANAIDEHLTPQGVGVIVAAHHQCMGCRGVKQPRAEMVTSALRGALLREDSARAEFLRLAMR
jgi:GTP cyclohydrolase I